MMEQTSAHDAMAADSTAPIETVSLGKRLREARERLGLSVADVSGQIKLAVRQIEALEADDLHNLPEMPFVRGFVRSYAKILQLDVQPLLEALPQTKASATPLAPDSVEAPFPSAHSPQRQNLIWLGAALLLSVLVVAFAVWHYTMPPAKSGAAQLATPSSAPADKAPVIPAPPALEAAIVPHPVSEVPPAAAETPTPPVVVDKAPASQAEPNNQQMGQADIPPRAAMLRLVFGEESWVEVKDRDGKMLTSQVNPPGSELRLNGQAPFTLVIGHAASVRLFRRDKQIDLTSHINPENEVARLTLE